MGESRHGVSPRLMGPSKRGWTGEAPKSQEQVKIYRAMRGRVTNLQTIRRVINLWSHVTESRHGVRESRHGVTESRHGVSPRLMGPSKRGWTGEAPKSQEQVKIYRAMRGR